VEDVLQIIFLMRNENGKREVGRETRPPYGLVHEIAFGMQK